MTSPERPGYILGEPRALRDAEKALLAAMLGADPETRRLLPSLDGCRVREMNDGGMGSLRFAGAPDRRSAGIAMEARFLDEDGTPVFAAILLDRHGELFELDLWKVDGAALKRIPPVAQIGIGRIP